MNKVLISLLVLGGGFLVFQMIKGKSFSPGPVISQEVKSLMNKSSSVKEAINNIVQESPPGSIKAVRMVGGQLQIIRERVRRK